MMSIEAPEAFILGKQMEKELVGKQIVSVRLEGLEKMGMRMNEDFERLEGKTIRLVRARGNGIHLRLHDEMNLFLAPEYGGTLLYHEHGSTIPEKKHFMLGFSDDTCFTVRLKGWGQISSANDSDLHTIYVYARDFSDVLSPLNEDFIFSRFSQALEDKSVNIKSALVGMGAVVVGIQNGAFQDIIYRAGIHPKRKVTELSMGEKSSLFNAINALIQERLKLGGKDQFVDLYGLPGRYLPLMGPNMRGEVCKACGTLIERLAHGGGHVYLCPQCQPL